MPIIADVASHTRAHLGHKVALAVVLVLGFCVPYFALERVAFVPVRTLAMSRIDEAIRFDPRWVWTYQSGYLLIAIVPWMFDTRADLARYVRGFFTTACLGFVCFLVSPVTGPRPEIVPATGMFGWLVWYDRPTNEFPSLHAGLMTYTVCCAARVTEGRLSRWPRAGLLAAGAVWVVAVSFAAVATRQHYAIDLPAGAFVGWLACRWSWS